MSEVMSKCKDKKETYERWKQKQEAWKEYEGVLRAFRVGVKKAKAQREMNLASGIKSNKKGFSKLFLLATEGTGAV